MPERKSILLRGQLWLGVLVVLSIQLGSILWFGERNPSKPREAAAGPEIYAVKTAPNALLDFLNPAIFALPHREGFSGAGWLITTNQEIQPFAWYEPPRWLQLQVAELGDIFHESLGKSSVESRSANELPEPGLFLPLLPVSRPFGERSTLHVDGAIASRGLIKEIALPSWPRPELVNNSVVQLLVDEQGVPFSTTLISRSGDAEADGFALQEARKARFKPVTSEGGALPQIAWGALSFQWHTVAPPSP